MRTRTTGAIALLGAVALVGAGPAAAEEPVKEEAPPAAAPPERKPQVTKKPAPKLLPANSPYLRAQIRQQRAETWRWQRLMGKPLTPASRSALVSRRPEYRRWALKLWTKRAATERGLAANPPRRSAWLCIYRHERHPGQGWQTRTGNGYYGGLQMDISFQRTYGAWLLQTKGTADRWTSIEQIWIAERAYRSGRGFYPWPNTARYCGLI